MTLVKFIKNTKNQYYKEYIFIKLLAPIFGNYIFSVLRKFTYIFFKIRNYIITIIDYKKEIFNKNWLGFCKILMKQLWNIKKIIVYSILILIISCKKN